MSKVSAHFYAANLHKWAYAPLSAAFLYTKSSLHFDSSGAIDPSPSAGEGEGVGGLTGEKVLSMDIVQSIHAVAWLVHRHT